MAAPYDPSNLIDASWPRSPSTLPPGPPRALDDGVGTGLTGSALKSQIIMLLAEGAKDEAVARRLGISLRTCRRHVADILDQLESSSRFQAGVRAALLGLVPAEQPTNPC
jgi:DNA-binding CsgD family transcriptional regulator